jgi:hypothetical protein
VNGKLSTSNKGEKQMITSNNALQEVRSGWSELAFKYSKEVGLEWMGKAYWKMIELTSESNCLNNAIGILSHYIQTGAMLTSISAIAQACMDECSNVRGNRYTNLEQLPREVQRTWNVEQVMSDTPILAIYVNNQAFCPDCFDFLFCDSAKELHYGLHEAYSRPYTVNENGINTKDVTIRHPLIEVVVYLGINEYDEPDTMDEIKAYGLRCEDCNALIVEAYEDDDDSIYSEITIEQETYDANKE